MPDLDGYNVQQDADIADAGLYCRKAKRGETVVLVDGTEWVVARAHADGDVWLPLDGDRLHGPYDTTEYRVLEQDR